MLRYIGLAGYRDRLQTECADCLRALTPGCEHLIVYAHSLGSVIALDTLLRYPDCMGDVKHLDLVTIGSPVKRLFSWGFPELFAPPLAMHAALSGRLTKFRWVNVYRPFDLIGASIGTRNGPIKDRTTGQKFKNHQNYWGDPKVTEEVEKAFAETPYPNTEPPRLVDNWPIRLTASSYGSVIEALWRYRDRISQYLLLTLLLAVAFRFLRSVPRTLGMFWTFRYSVFGVFLVLVSLLGAVTVLWRLKGAWLEWILPFIRSFYGTLPDSNPTGLPDGLAENKTASHPPTRRLWLITSAVVLVPVLAAAWILYFERRWTPCSQALSFPEVNAISVSDSGLLQVAGLNYYWEYALPGLAKLSETRLRNSTEYLVGFTGGPGNLVLERDIPQRGTCVVAVNRNTLDEISQQFCRPSIPAGEASVSNSGRFTAIVSVEGTAGKNMFRLLLRDGDRAQVRDVGEVHGVMPFQFGGDDCLYYSKGNKLLRACNLGRDGDVHPTVAVTAKGTITAFAIDTRSHLVATIEDYRDLCVYADGKLVSKMLVLKRVYKLIAMAPDGRTIALASSGDVTLWNWKSYDYVFTPK